MKTSNLLGIVFAVPGAAIVTSCVLSLHDCNAWMLSIGCAMLTIGALIFDPSTVADALKSLAWIAAPYIPIKGQRKDDPPSKPEG